jgi:hypothetical protein
MSSQSQQSSPGVEEVMVRELTRVLEPFAEAAKAADNGNPEPLVELLDQVGVDRAIAGVSMEPIEKTVTGSVNAAEALISVTTAIVEADSFADALASNPSLVKDAIDAVQGIVKTIKALDGLELGPVDVESLGEAILDLLIIEYLEEFHGTVYNLARLGGIIVEYDDKPDDVRFEKFSTLLSEPNKIPAEVFGWGTEDFRSMVVLYYLRALVWEFGLPADIETPTDVGQSENPTDELTVPVLVATAGDSFATTGIRVVPMPGNGGLPGLAIVPYGEVSSSKEFGLGGGWTFNVAASGKLDDWGMIVRPEQKPELGYIDGEEKDVPLELQGEAGISYSGSTGDRPEKTLLGNPEGSRLSVRQVSLKAKVEYDGDEIVFTVALPATGTIGVHPDDFDGFLSKVMPQDGIFYNFDAVVGWSSDQGLFFERGGSLEVAIPQNASIGPVSLKEIYLEATPPAGGTGSDGSSSGQGGNGGGTQTAEGTITIAGAASAEVTLGPVTATVKRMGVEADVSFPEDKDGNMGPVDMEIGFKPPSGAGVSIDAGPVSGGGYLEFDPDNERYAGVLQLKTEKLTINAVGLLTTELPGGKDGFSLLLIISGEFPPVQLGMGFTLNGVGGLIGVNRSIKQKPLAKAVRSGSVGSIMFPEDPVANSQRIISDLRSIFPPTDGIHVVGPMAKLGYGGGSMITIDVGVILSIPTWKIVLLGKMSTALPSDEQAMIELNLAVRGLLDIPNKRVAIDASLYDSRIVAFTVSGDMALRSNWGDKPRFALSVGGWNPRFEPPSDFPDLDRLKASMGKKGDNFRVELKGYLAVTSNTFQVGASVFAKAQAGPLQAKGTLAFDALFEFNPFKFVIDFLAKFSVTFQGKGLSVKLAGTFMGPGPFRIKGTVSIELLMLSVKKDINATIGPSKSKEELPRARILPKLTEELGKPVNWRAQLPADGPEVATFREVEPGEEQVLAHPLGEIGVRQTVVPLDYEIEKFGKATPSGYTTFTIDTVRVNGSASVSLAAETEEDFAPAKYQKLSDSEKLNSDAFEKLPAGRKVDTEGVYCGDYEASPKNVRSAEFTYECTVIDRPRDNWATDLADLGGFAADDLLATSTLSAEVGESLVQVSPSAQSPARRAGENRFRLSDADKRAFDAQAAGFASEIDVSRYGADAESDSAGSQQVVRGGGDPDVGGLSGAVSMDEQSYTIATADDLRELDGVDGRMTKSEAQRELRTVRESNPEAAKQLRVVEAREVQSGQAAATDGGQQ